MDAQTSETKFQQADQLFRAARYQEALVLLEELNRHHPNAKNILYPAAMCLDKLGRSQEALPLCDQLIGSFQDPRATALKAEIEGRSSGSALDSMNALSGLDLDGLDGLNGAQDILDIPSTTVAHKTVEPEGIPWLKYGLIALGVVAVLLVVIVPVMTYEAPPPGSEPAVVSGDEPVNTAMIYVGAFACFMTIVVFQMAGAYLALMLMRRLPHEDFASNAFNLFVSFFLASILESSLFGVVLTMFYFSKAYDLGFGGVVFLYIARILFGIVGLFLGILMFIGSIASVLPNVGTI